MPPPVPPGPVTAAVPAQKARPDLESKIGQVWLNRIGIVAMLVGIALFLMYAFQNQWIGPQGQVAIGVLAGMALVAWSERFRRKGHAPFSYSLKAVGIGALYLSFWAAFQAYDKPVLDAPVAFAGMVLVTAATIAMAVAQNAELLATFAMIGGFASPLMVSTGQNREVELFSYLAVLNLAMLVLSRFKPWKRQLWLNFTGTLILYWGWYNNFYYSQPQRTRTVLFAALFAAIFASLPLVTPFERSSRGKGPSITLTLLPLFNAANFFLALYAIHHNETVTLTWYALGLAAAYLGISTAFKRRFTGAEAQVINLLHIAIAIAFITIAIPLKLDRHWITIGWLIESAVLLWIAVKTGTTFLRFLAGSALALGVFRLLIIDSFWRTESTLMFNPRFATYLVAIAIMGAILYFGKRFGSEREQIFIRLAGIALNLLALVALTLEAADYFARQQMALRTAYYYGNQYLQLVRARDFSYSAIWLIYGAGLMAAGFWKNSAFIRWQALVLMALTTGKVFIYDLPQLGAGFRILSFIGLGVVLLAISFAYQRDWLKLSSRNAEKSS